MELPLNPVQWTMMQRIFFRFFFAFFLLYIFFNPNGVLPGTEPLFNMYIQPFHRLIPWIGRHILHLSQPITIFTNGSGDTTYDNLILLFLFLIAILTALVWSVADRNRASYNVLFYWLTAIVRYYLAITMLTYGFVKVFKLQFSYPGIHRLLEPYGDSSPMGLAWAFMGYSKGYNYFTGFAEVLAGSLLLFRRTTAIGAFLAFMVSANIMAMNYCFDIPVKLLSSMMVILSLFLLGDNIRKLFGLFFLHRTTTLSMTRPPRIRKKSLRITLLTVKSLLIAYIFIGNISDSLESMQAYGDNARRAPLYGIYNTSFFVVNKDTIAPLQTDTLRWKQLEIDGFASYSYGATKMMNDSFRYYVIRTDTIRKFLSITDNKDSTKRYLLHYRNPGNDSLVLWGSRLWGRQADSVLIALTHYPLNRFRLSSREFHWISEYPYNR
jgi:uncharacterized membrane protein YphA (DoxX/SURF4 family)